MQPDGQVRRRGRQPDRHRAAGVGQVPQHQRAGLVRGRGDRRQVEQRARTGTPRARAPPPPPIGSSACDHRVQPTPRRRCRPRRRAASARGPRHSPCSTYRSVGKSSAVDSTTDRPGRADTGRPGQLVEVHRGRVGDHHLARPGAEQRGRRSGRRSARASEIQRRPGPDQPAAPLVGSTTSATAARGGPRAAGRASCRPGRAAPGAGDELGRGTRPAGRPRPAPARTRAQSRSIRQIIPRLRPGYCSCMPELHDLTALEQAEAVRSRRGQPGRAGRALPRPDRAARRRAGRVRHGHRRGRAGPGQGGRGPADQVGPGDAAAAARRARPRSRT